MAGLSAGTAVALAGMAVAGASCGASSSSIPGGTPVFTHSTNVFVPPASPAGSPGDGSPGDGSPGDGPPPSTPAAAASTPVAEPDSACTQWPGLQNLEGLSVSLRQMASDEAIYGDGSTQVNSDGLAVDAGAQSLNGVWEELPKSYAYAVQDYVMAVAVSPYAASQDQLTTAANNALTLYNQISQGCLVAP